MRKFLIWSTLGFVACAPALSWANDGSTLFHDTSLKIELGFGKLSQKDGGAANLQQESQTFGLDFKTAVGEFAFVRVMGLLSKDDFDSSVVSFPLALIGDAEVRGYDLMVGLWPRAGVRTGLIYGQGAGDVSYQFVAFPGVTPSEVSSKRYGAFFGVSVPVHPVLVHADLAYVRSEMEQTYPATNSVTVANWGADLVTLSAQVEYDVTPAFELRTTVSVYDVVSQTVAPAQTPLDERWGSVALNASYAVNANWSLDLTGETWFGNDKYDYRRLALGATYRF